MASDTRPAIPAELRRRVLVEAGHRCAIQTCRHTADVDLHHIIPWERCREHTYDNLIALCPNCHRRADAGEIDRKSLLLYKAQLKAILDERSADTRAGTEAAAPETPSKWETRTITEKRTEHPRYGAEIEFPHFIGDVQDIDEINALVHATVLERLLNLRSVIIHPDDEEMLDALPITGSSELGLSYSVTCYTPSLVSVRFDGFFYGAGAAHPIGVTVPLNFQRNPLITLTLEDMLSDSESGLQVISEFCARSIIEQKAGHGDLGWIAQGTKPEHNNFRLVNITPTGLFFTFSEYQVGCGAEGPSQVTVPYAVLKEVLDRRCAVAQLG
ncbi:MAG TPA: HNH endonuclease [Candidatus Binatia bacterium]|nr:HNH endonuclease [Candidatus Binatia bacterium]